MERQERYVLMISTEFSGDAVKVINTRSKEQIKPHSVVQYNLNMGGIDKVDQMLSYYSTERKSIKWYKKIAFHIFEMILFNSYFLFKKANLNSKLVIFYYRLKIIDYLCGSVEPTVLPPPQRNKTINKTHFLSQFPSKTQNNSTIN